MVKIKVINPILSTISKYDYNVIKPAITFETSYWKPGRFKKDQIFYNKECYIHKKGALVSIYTGHIDRIQDWCDEYGIECEIEGKYKLYKYGEPKLPGITFYPEQKELIENALPAYQGVIQAPTGIGKTIIMMGMLSACPTQRILILTHTIDLINQLIENLEKFGFDKPTKIGGGNKYPGLFNRITVSTIQSFAKIDPEEYRNKFDIVVVDEVHHISKFKGNYAKVLGQIYSPGRFGFSATIPERWETILAIEAFIGGMIGELTMKKAIEGNLIVKPKVKILKSEGFARIKTLRNYQEVYQRGIVENVPRNNQIMKEAKKYIDRGMSVLILITRIEHGENLIIAALKNYLDPFFVRGATDSKTREAIKKSLIEKKTKCVISTAVWKEGVDIPSLDVVINAGGGRSEIMTLQNIGRGLRKFEGKERALVIDFFDNSHRFLVEHFGERISIYMENDWL